MTKPKETCYNPERQAGATFQGDSLNPCATPEMVSAVEGVLDWFSVVGEASKASLAAEVLEAALAAAPASVQLALSRDSKSRS